MPGSRTPVSAPLMLILALSQFGAMAAEGSAETGPATPAQTVPGAPAPGPTPALADDPAGRELLATAQRAIAAYHDGHRDAPNRLRVVYFYPNDLEPLPNYAERLDRVMTDVNDFYRDGLARLGIENEGLPLERKDGRLVLHLVRGKHPLSSYSYDDGMTPTREIHAALAGIVDLNREHVLVIHGLCRQEPDGRYVFNAPYYGWGFSGAGLCHAADCELLDPLLLTETKRKIVYTEHYHPRMEQTLAHYNTWYLGGIAHELGHGLGLPHDSGDPAELPWGTSLMGNGNHAYRRELWGGGKPAFLSRASALRLAAHPLVTGSNRGRWELGRGKFRDVEFSNANGTLRMTGKVRGAIAPYAVTAQVNPVGSSTDHGANTYSVAVKDGAFDLPIGGLKPGSYHLNLAILHVNGGTSERRLRFRIDTHGQPDAEALNRIWYRRPARASFLQRKSNAPASPERRIRVPYNNLTGAM